MNVPEYSVPVIEPVTGRQRSLMLKALIPCFIGTILLGLLSDGVHHDDDLTHYLMARWSRWFPGYLLHVWGRPGATIPMAAVAWIGDADVAWHVCRLLSACVAAATAWIAATLAARKAVGPAWVVVLLCYVQPFALMLAATTLTENYLAFYLIAAAVLLDKGRAVIASIVFSLALLTRHETLVLLPVWWAGVIWSSECRIANSELKTQFVSGPQRSLLSLFAIRYSLFAACAASLWAPIVHNCLHYAAFAKWPAAMFLTPKGSTEYVATSVLGYVPSALQAIPPAVFALALIGGVALIRRRSWLIPAIAGTFLAAHCAITALGVFASGGFPRFMAGIAPFVAILAVAGIQHVRTHWHDPRRTSAAWLTLALVLSIGWLAVEVERRAGRLSLPGVFMLAIRVEVGVLIAVCAAQAARWPHSLARARLAAVVLMSAVTLLQTAVWIRPLRLRPAQRQIQTATAWLHANNFADRPIYATNAWFSHFMGFVENPRVHKGKRLLAAMPVGTIVAWDSIYSASDYHGVKLMDLKMDVRHYRRIKTFEPDPTDLQKMRLVLFEKIAETPVPPDPDRPYPPSTSADQVEIHTSYYIRP